MATTIIVKMGKARYAPVTLVPLTWLVAVTFTASWHKMFDPNPRIGFLAHARQLAASAAPSHEVSRLIFNDRLDAAVTGVLVCMVTLILLESVLVWMSVLSGRMQARVKESPFVHDAVCGGGTGMSESEVAPALTISPAAEHCSAGQPGAAVSTRLVAKTTLLLSALREIFDESAYSRFLCQPGMTSCASAYAEFLREQEALKARRPSCC